MNSHYTRPDQENWQGRNSNQKEYIHENIQLLDLSRQKIPVQKNRTPALIGYACDEGVRRNLGRPGAKKGPEALRKALGKLPLLKGAVASLWDAGDIHCEDKDLESCQEAFATAIEQLVQNGFMPLAIGGGHDIAFAHFRGLAESLGNGKRLGILNFDAHFDLRLPSPKGHSGSPFLQIARDCEASGREFHYGCIGVRRDANPQELWDRARDLEVMWLPREDLRPGRMDAVFQKLRDFIAPLDGIYLTIDLDGFASSYAPGVSAASPMGYAPDAIMPCLDLILKSGKLKSMDIAELNPPLDRDGQTSALAASLIHRVLHHPGLF